MTRKLPRGLLFAAGLLLGSGGILAAPEDRPARPVHLFAVLRPDLSDPALIANPVAVYRGGEFTDPLSSPDTEPFLLSFFEAGREYRVLSGGVDVGTVTIQSRLCDHCPEAWVRLDARARPTGNVMALATDAPRVARAAGFRRAPESDQRTAALVIAKEALARHGVAAADLADLKIVNLTATDLDGDGSAELIGSYQIGRHDLFQLLEPSPDGYRTAVERYNFMEGGQTVRQDERLVDHADLDGDGVGEVITIRGSSDGYDYAVYQKKEGRWRQVYEGGGFGK